MWRRLRRLSIILFLSVSIACTHSVPPVTPPMPKFKSVAIVSKGPAHELEASFGVAIGRSGSVVGAGVGAGAGALAGVAWSLLCGPLVIFCAGSIVPITAMVGATGGGLTGAGIDSLKEPSQKQLLLLEKQLAALEKVFGGVVEQRTLHEEVRDALVRQIPPHRLADTSSAEGLLQLSLFDVLFTQTTNGKYTLTLKYLMIAKWNHSTRHLNNGRRLYRYSTNAMTLEEWLENDEEVLTRALDECVDGLVEQMVEEIHFRES